MQLEQQLADARRQNEALLRELDAHKARADFAESMLRRWMDVCMLQATIAATLAEHLCTEEGQ
jgi:hypothetical protein